MRVTEADHDKEFPVVDPATGLSCMLKPHMMEFLFNGKRFPLAGVISVDEEAGEIISMVRTKPLGTTPHVFVWETNPHLGRRLVKFRGSVEVVTKASVQHLPIVNIFEQPADFGITSRLEVWE